MEPDSASIPAKLLAYGTILAEMRRLTYRHALTAFFFAGSWFVLGVLLLLSPLPGALGIVADLFQAWLLLFFLALGISGAMLTMAACNGIFPPVLRPPTNRRPPSKRPETAPASAPDATGKAWSQPLPSRSRDV